MAGCSLAFGLKMGRMKPSGAWNRRDLLGLPIVLGDSALEQESKFAQPGPDSLISAMREKMLPYWSPAEAGGIFLLASLNGDEHEGVVADLYGSQPAKGGTREFARVLAGEARRFLRFGQLDSGTYELENYHDTGNEGSLQLDADGRRGMPIPSSPRFTFTVKDEHLQLLRRMNVREWHGLVELMDVKRPYGDMTAHFIDMADALGDEIPRNASGLPDLPEKAIARYVALHGEMLFAVQAFWTNAKTGTWPAI